MNHSKLRNQFGSLIALCIFSIGLLNAQAATIVFTYEGVASGTLNGTSFDGTHYVITGIADQNNRTGFSNGWFVNHDSASILFANELGLIEFVTLTRTFVNNSVSNAGFSQAGMLGGDLLIIPPDSSLTSWDLSSSISPIVGSQPINPWALQPVATDSGVLIFTTHADTITFSAILVPEPSQLLLLLAALSMRILRRDR